MNMNAEILRDVMRRQKLAANIERLPKINSISYEIGDFIGISAYPLMIQSALARQWRAHDLPFAIDIQQSVMRDGVRTVATAKCKSCREPYTDGYLSIGRTGYSGVELSHKTQHVLESGANHFRSVIHEDLALLERIVKDAPPLPQFPMEDIYGAVAGAMIEDGYTVVQLPRNLRKYASARM